MWRQIGVFLSVFILGFLHVSRHTEPSYLFFLTPFVFLLVFYFLIIQDFASIVAAFCFSIFSTIYTLGQTHDFVYLLLFLILILVFGGAFLYSKNWNQKVDEVKQKKQRMLQEAKALEERYQVRVESLKHLERRVNSLVHLFEIARDFNECLNFSEMLSVVDQKISKELSFVRGTLILLPSNLKENKQVELCLTFGTEKRSPENFLESFAAECLKTITPTNQVVKFESSKEEESNRFAPYGVKFPLWLFPLLVERQLIALMTIEGGVANDFQKFEILASQLALQVKKIRLYETVKENSIVDGLTNVFVRRHFMERFQEEMKRAFRYQFPLSVLMVDVDHFKSYNDKFGHLVGDKTLREVAQVIRENVRRVDVIGRYGGEEFVIVAPEIEKIQGQELAERIRSAVAKKRLRIYDEETQITVSIGISSFPEDLSDKPYSDFSEASLLALLEKADRALYKAKEEGRNRVVGYR